MLRRLRKHAYRALPNYPVGSSGLGEIVSLCTSMGHGPGVNTASRRVLAKVGFTETERKEPNAVYGNNLFTTRRL